MGGLIFLAIMAALTAGWVWWCGPFMSRAFRSTTSAVEWRDIVPKGTRPPAAEGRITATAVVGRVDGRHRTRLLVAVDEQHILVSYMVAGGTGGLLLDRTTALPIVRRGHLRHRLELANGRVVLNEPLAWAGTLRGGLAARGWPLIDESTAASSESGPSSDDRTAPPPGWYPDPTGRHRSRYWDGSAWTAWVLDGTQTGTDPL